MFSFVSVCRSVQREVTITHDDWTSPCRDPRSPAPLDRGPVWGRSAPPLVTSGDQDWRPVQTCPPKDHSLLLVTSGGQDWRPVQTSLLEGPPTSADIWWLLKHLQLGSKRWVHILLESFFVLDLFQTHIFN